MILSESHKNRLKELAGILSESTINEAQKDPKLDREVQSMFGDITLRVPETVSEPENSLKRQILNKVDYKVGKIQQNNFEYPNLYVLKIGTFNTLEDGQESKITFDYQGKVKDSFYAIVFQDKIWSLNPIDTFLEIDKNLMKYAQEFVDSNNFKVDSIKISETYDTKNIIEIEHANDSIMPEPKKKEKLELPTNVKYRKGQNYNHPKFGKGKILATKLYSVDAKGDKLMKVTIDFPGGQKSILLKEKSAVA